MRTDALGEEPKLFSNIVQGKGRPLVIDFSWRLRLDMCCGPSLGKPSDQGLLIIAGRWALSVERKASTLVKSS